MTSYDFQVERQCSRLPHTKYAPGSYESKYELNKQIIDWLLDNIPRGQWNFWNSSGYLSFYRAEDAMAFKLAWM